MPQDKNEIIQRVLNTALLIKFQRLLPISVSEVCVCLLHTLCRELRLYGIVLHCEIYHDSKGLFLIVIAESVYADEINGVE